MRKRRRGLCFQTEGGEKKEHHPRSPKDDFLLARIHSLCSDQMEATERAFGAKRRHGDLVENKILCIQTANSLG